MDFTAVSLPKGPLQVLHSFLPFLGGPSFDIILPNLVVRCHNAFCDSETNVAVSSAPGADGRDEGISAGPVVAVAPALGSLYAMIAWLMHFHIYVCVSLLLQPQCPGRYFSAPLLASGISPLSGPLAEGRPSAPYPQAP